MYFLKPQRVRKLEDVFSVCEFQAGSGFFQLCGRAYQAIIFYGQIDGNGNLKYLEVLYYIEFQYCNDLIFSSVASLLSM